MTATLLNRAELLALQDDYVAALDEDRLEDWPGFFTEDCLYEIIPRENLNAGLPAPLVRLDNIRMLRDRVVSLRRANIFEQPIYRHALSGLTFHQRDDGSFDVRSSYIVVNTSMAGDTRVYQSGQYLDHVVRTKDGLRFATKRAVYDTSRVPTLLAYPV